MDSPFQVDTLVAVVRSQPDRTVIGRRKVVRVYQNGNFIITDPDGTPNARQQWRDGGSGKAFAAARGAFSYGVAHLEIWTPELEAEAIRCRQAARLDRRRKVIYDRLNDFHRNDLTEEMIAAIERAIGIEAALAPSESST